ncbi:DUF1990 domain-containing protein [Hymenobacter latericus]|uniref:DUF1990 domain-containing protein n=1 Tax=Hymenobacter sp. YIM 151858-1 TaxID=2987688 RepID=UPI00222676D5|nr:DUF1990 domain-containing protein [Hymenobacter sp. YIM 151858-1]UYZ57636.1 DUF1990 domain-containing protein [Hymenobacter sp. YIM 151858-1]
MSQNPQTPDQGAGPFTERRYYIDIAHPKQPAEALMHDIQCNIERYSPGLLAEFHKEKGEKHGLHVGDEFHIKIIGPWNGSVRVTEVAKQHFELLTLEGHPEAGHIRFSLRQLPNQPGVLRFEIHSKARARDGLVAFAYGTLGVGKQVQEQTWVTFCQRVAEESGGEALGPVQVDTTEHDGAEKRKEHHERS